MRNKLLRLILTVCALICLLSATSKAQTVAPISGLGNVQFFDNSGAPLTSGVLYSYQAGTSTQQATYTDSTGLIQNVNPISFGSGARAAIWLSVGQFYKFVLCAQNDGAACAAGDIIFTVDQVPGGSSGGGSGSSPFTGVFISSTASPSTTGALRLATGDTICWRNAAGSTNLCISKDSNDQLSWAGGSVKFPEIAPPTAVAGFDLLWADSTAHRWMMKNNGGGASQVVASGVDVNTSDQVNQLHFGATATPICSTAPITSQTIVWNGTNLCPGGPVFTTASAATVLSIGATTMTTVGASNATYRFNYYATQTALGTACTGNSTFTLTLTYTDPNAGAPANLNFLGQVIVLNGTIGQMIGFSTLPQTSQTIRAKTGTTISYFTTYTAGTNCAPAPQYQVFPVLEQLTVN